MLGGRVESSGFGDFGNDVTAIVKLVVPAEYRSTNPQTISIFEFQGPSTTRRAWLSKTRGDMSNFNPPYYVQDSGPNFNYCINGNPVDQYGTPIAVFHPGETWWIMIRNEYSFFGQPLAKSCNGGGCHIGLKWYPPN
jgi:hypothetical protein